MAKKRRSRTPKRSRRATSSTKTPPSMTCPDDTSGRFVRDLVIRGEAREPDKDGTLAPEATHAIVRRRGRPAEVRRARFKMF